MTTPAADEILFSCWTKATTAEGTEVRRSANWVTARRARLYVTRTELRCGDWRIPYTDIREAVLSSFRQSFFPGYVLRVDAGDVHYQFGLNGWNRFWKGDLPFPVRRERRRLGLSPYSKAIRVLAVAYLLYLLLRRLL